MIYVGIDVAKNKHDFVILDKDSNVLEKNITIPNNLEGFTTLRERIMALEKNPDEIKIGLEATGHYSSNILNYVTSITSLVYVFNPFYVNQFRKSLTLRKTKTDKEDSKVIARMLISGVQSEPYSPTLYHKTELKSLTRYHADLIEKRGRLRVSVTRLLDILFPELSSIQSHIHSPSIYALLSEYPGADELKRANLIHLTNLLCTASHGRYGREKALELRDAARKSIGSPNPARSLELRQCIKLIEAYSESIAEVEAKIEDLMKDTHSLLRSIPGIGATYEAAIIAEVGDFSRFSSPDKILAYAGMSPSTYQSGNFMSSHAKMEKRGSKYLRYALFNAARQVCMMDPAFGAYLAKKLAEGKHYYVAISHVAKRLVRVMYAVQTSGRPYVSPVVKAC